MAERSRLLSLSHWLSRETHIMWTERKAWVSPNYSIFVLRNSFWSFGTTILEDPMHWRFKTLRRRQDQFWFSVTVLIIYEKWKESHCKILVLFQRLELQSNTLRFTCGWAKVLTMDHIVQILSWLAWPPVFSMSLLWCMNRGVRPKVSMRWQDLRLKTHNQND